MLNYSKYIVAPSKHRTRNLVFQSHIFLTALTWHMPVSLRLLGHCSPIGAPTKVKLRILHRFTKLAQIRSARFDAHKGHLYGFFSKSFKTKLADLPVWGSGRKPRLSWSLTGGYVVILTSKKNVEPFEPSMDRLVQEGAWRMLNRKLVPDYLKGEDALLYSFQKWSVHHN